MAPPLSVELKFVPMPPAVAPSGAARSAQELGWRIMGIPDNWPPGSYLDCCYCTNGGAARGTLAAGFSVLTHNYGLNAPHWCDVFVGNCQPDRSWVPLEDLGGILAGNPCSRYASIAATDRPHSLLVAAYAARTLQQRVDGAKAALREGGAAAAIDARLLLTASLPGMSPATKLKGLVSTADAAIAAAERERREVAARAQQGQDSSGDPDPALLTVTQRAAVRAVMEVCHCKTQVGWGDDPRTYPDDAAVMKRLTMWLNTVDPHMLVGMESGNVAVMPWLRTGLTGHVDIAALLKECKPQCKETPLGFLTCTMAVHYNLYFVAYAAKGQRGGGPKGQLVKQALAAIKRVDPEAWVPKLLAGMEIADGVVHPSFMLGSKQEAMACCNMLGRHWRRIDERAWSAMLVTLLEELKVGPTHAWAKVGMASLSDDVMKLVSVFNTEELLSSQGYILVHHPDILEAVDPGDVPFMSPDGGGLSMAWCRALLARMLVLTALERATVNLPPIHSHWEHWQGSPVLTLLGTSSAADTAAMLEDEVLSYHDGTSDILDQLIDLKTAGCADVHQTVEQLTETVQVLVCMKARCLWQVGEAASALPYLQDIMEAETPCSQRLASMHRFLEAEVARSSTAPCASVTAGHRQEGAEPDMLPGPAQRAAGQQAPLHQQPVEQQAPLQQQHEQQAQQVPLQQQQVPQQQQQQQQQQAPLPQQQEQQVPPQQQQAQQMLTSHHSPSTTTPDAVDGNMAGSPANSCPQQPAQSHVVGASSSEPGEGEVLAAAAATAAAAAAAASDSPASISPHSNHGACHISNGQLKQKACVQCGRTFATLKRCAGCGEVRYCGSTCQRLHWRAGHSTACSRRRLKGGAAACDQHL